MVNTVDFRLFEERDIEFIHKCKNDEQLNKMTVGNFKKFSHEESEQWVRNCMKRDRDDRLFWAVCTNDDERRCIGWVSLVNIDMVNKSAETGAILIGDKNYNDGFAWIESAVFLLKYGFEDLRLNRIYGVCLSEHKMSSQITKVIYMQTEGILRQAVYKNGQYNDLIYSGILRDEYFQRKEHGDYKLMTIIRNLRKVRHE